MGCRGKRCPRSILYDTIGDPGAAAEHYREFITRWEGADPKLQPRVSRARERVAAVSASHDQGNPGQE